MSRCESAGRTGGFDCATDHRLTKSEVDADIGLLYETFPDAVEGLRAELGPEAPVAEAIEMFVPRCGLEPELAGGVRQGLRAVTEAESADMSERQSLRWMWNEMEYDGDYFGDLPAGGYRSLVDAMAAGLDRPATLTCSASRLAAGPCSPGSTQSARLASADGAMTSGIREAKRLLQQPGVRLGRVS